MDFNTPASQLTAIGPIYTRRLAKLGIQTVEDLLYHFPFRYDDYSIFLDIKMVQPGQTATIKGRVLSLQNEYTKNGKKIQKAKVDDGTASIEIVWFNQPYLIKNMRVGEWYCFSGKVDWFGRTLTIVSPEYERFSTTNIHTGRLVPVYPETYGISSKWLRSRIAPVIIAILPTIQDFMPTEIVRVHNLLPLAKALSDIHFPASKIQAEQAKKRLAFDELFLIQLASFQRKMDWQKKPLAHQFSVDKEKISKLVTDLPFRLTNAQERCLQEVCEDLRRSQPMNRLLEGDVGSGKTVVAAIAIYIAYINGYQATLMAPTQILATQHYETLQKLLLPTGLKITLITGNTNKLGTKTLTEDLVIGTHALVYNRVNFSRLGLVIIDEQHRFGVEQRGKLTQKGRSPHVLTMTATPIPRTVALTLYGDLDLSVIDELPPGRPQTKTWVVPTIKRKGAYSWIRQHVKNTDEQAFIVCPFIEESETLQSIKAVKVEFKKLSEEIFPDLRLGLLHGKLKSVEKKVVVDKFRRGELDILVSTPVVEVGIDIPQATIMVIEGSDHFGLAQLHQLRGRVGRGTKESYCLLFTEATDNKTVNRLKAMEKLKFGMELAELDLKMRGPGEIYGTAQHGFPDLRIASFADLELIQQTHKAAEAIFDGLDQFPNLGEKLRKYNTQIIEPT